MRKRKIFKLLRSAEWARLEQRGRFEGSPDDLSDGFVHLSTDEQIRGTAARHFAGEDGLVLAEVDEPAMGEALKWEASRGGALFPHLHAPLLLEHVVRTWPLPLDSDGVHDFPAGTATP